MGELSIVRLPICLLATAVIAASTLIACGSSAQDVPNPGGLNLPPISISEATVTIPAAGGIVALPTAPSPEPSNYSGYTMTATFPAVPVTTSVSVSDVGGPDVATPPTNIWGATCPFPLQEIEMVFPAALTMSSTPSIAISNLNSIAAANFLSQANAPYYYNELFDSSTTPSTVIASEQVSYSSTWPAGTVTLPSMKTAWSIVAGHRYVFEIVSSNGQFLSCSGIYG